MRLTVKTIIAAALLCTLCRCARTHHPARPIRVITFNIRMNTPSDGPNAWPYRRDMAAGMIRFHHADIVGIQEALSGQVRDLEERLPDYAWTGVGWDDGIEQGEFMAVFYLMNRLTLLGHGTFWLSEHPETPGLGWDAACNRTVTWAEFEDNASGHVFYLFNTHFDHQGVTARRESAELLLKMIGKIAGKSDVIVTADLNATPDSAPVAILTRPADNAAGLSLVDSKAVSMYPHHGPDRTFTGFELAELGHKDRPIDYIFVRRDMKVLNHGTLSDTFDGFLPSDHMPVLAEIIMEQKQ
ncbi:endonuclease/exonuclease/phosphatase family protein [bacterium]|nr:endonuclease/exonuclease/phosphatase family protein [bacterium]